MVPSPSFFDDRGVLLKKKGMQENDRKSRLVFFFLTDVQYHFLFLPPTSGTLSEQVFLWLALLYDVLYILSLALGEGGGNFVDTGVDS